MTDDNINARLDAEELDALYPPPIDRVDSILDVACSVLADYGAGPGSTRIERLARWVVANLDACPTMEQVGSITKFHCAQPHTPDEVRRRMVVWRIGSMICLGLENDEIRSDELDANDARGIATAFLRAAEKADD